MANVSPSRPKFTLPHLQNNPTGWGPCELPEQFKDTLYQPFSKYDRLGKVADWSGNVYQGRRAANKYQNLYGFGGQAYVYDAGCTPKPMHQRSRPKFSQQKIKRDREKRNARRMGGRQPIAEKKGREWDRQRQQQQSQFGYCDEGSPGDEVRKGSDVIASLMAQRAKYKAQKSQMCSNLSGWFNDSCDGPIYDATYGTKYIDEEEKEEEEKKKEEEEKEEEEEEEEDEKKKEEEEKKKEEEEKKKEEEEKKKEERGEEERERGEEERERGEEERGRGGG
ncbi:hypothetical protein EMCRGX_G027802 [Ephydatia muelleri]